MNPATAMERPQIPATRRAKPGTLLSMLERNRHLGADFRAAPAAGLPALDQTPHEASRKDEKAERRQEDQEHEHGVRILSPHDTPRVID
jgi:hypothetical protein